MSHEEIMKSYYPYTDKCGHDGNPCLKEKCKLFIEDKVCWDRKFEKIVEDIFSTDMGYIYFNDRNDDRYVSMGLHINLLAYEREDKKIPPMALIEFYFNSERLAKKVKEEFKLDSWEIEGRCEEGGDDHALRTLVPASYLEEDHIINLLKDVKSLLPKIVEFEKKINVCSICGNLAESLTDYKDKAVCPGCERKALRFAFDSHEGKIVIDAILKS
jgi:rubrerythrin